MTFSEKKWMQLLLFPPVVSMLISLYDLGKNRSRASLYRFLVCFVIIIAYWYVAYDTILKFFNVTSMQSYSVVNWLYGDPLSTIAMVCNPLVDYYYFMFLYWLISGYLFYTAISSHYYQKISYVGIILIIFGLNLTNWANLTYFTFSCTFAIFVSERIKNSLIAFIPAMFIIYLLHPGVLLVFLPSIPLFYLWKIGRIKISLIYLILYGYTSHLLFNNTLSLDFLGNSDIANGNILMYENYTGDGKWGTAGQQFGFRGQIWFFSLYSLLAIGLLLIYKYFYLLRMYFVSAIVVIAIITLYNSYKFYTFSERMGIIALLSCVVLFSILDSKNVLLIFVKRIIVLLVVLSYVSSLFVFVQPRDEMFVNIEKGYDVSIRSCIVPTAICILDLHHLGYSDSYLKFNANNRHK